MIEEYQRKRYQELVRYRKEALKNKQLFCLKIKMAEQTLQFDNIRVNKKKFKLRKSKQPIDLMSVNFDQILVSDKFKHKSQGKRI